MERDVQDEFKVKNGAETLQKEDLLFEEDEHGSFLCSEKLFNKNLFMSMSTN